jgi:hypothetical protein
MLLVRRSGERGRFITVWSWGDVDQVVTSDDGAAVSYRNGDRHEHRRTPEGWSVGITAAGVRRDLPLRGLASPTPLGQGELEPDQAPAGAAPLSLPLTARLGEEHYRPSELSWSEAGSPSALVALSSPEPGVLLVEVSVPRSERIFVAPGVENPLDNEPASINGDGVQLYVTAAGASGGWLLVPDVGTPSVHLLPIEGWNGGLALDAAWSATAQGYAVSARVHLPPGVAEAGIDLIVNETAPGRARRRGQLVLSGARGEFVYLRGDRHDPVRLLRISLADD